MTTKQEKKELTPEQKQAKLIADIASAISIVISLIFTSFLLFGR